MKKLLPPPTPVSSMLPTIWGSGMPTPSQPAHHPIFNPFIPPPNQTAFQPVPHLA